MPRPKSKSWPAKGSADRHHLSDSAIEDLTNHLGLDPINNDEADRAKQPLLQVEKILGSYPGLVETFQNSVPSAADYRQEAQNLIKLASKLRDELRKRHPWIRESIEHYVPSINDLPESIDKAIANAKRQKLGGHPRKNALKTLVLGLHNTFVKFYAGVPTDSLYQGAVKPLSASKNDEVEFIKCALQDAGISAPKNIRELMDEIGAALPQERDKLIEKIARKRSRQQAEAIKAVESSSNKST